MSILKQIVQIKKDRLSSAKRAFPFTSLKSLIADTESPRNFLAAVTRGDGGIRIIAEIKKASPSKGLLRGDFDPVKIASIYEAKKVDAISVITEEDFFQGSLAYLPEVREAVSRPVLRKDFIFDEYQIYEARANGADAVLLIGGILSRNQASDYLLLARELGMAVLFEVHDYAELEAALSVEAPIIGINNRNLKTLSIDIRTTPELKRHMPPDKIVVSESGIRTREDVVFMESAGIDTLLIGSCLMESADIGRKIDELRGI